MAEEMAGGSFHLARKLKHFPTHPCLRVFCQLFLFYIFFFHYYDIDYYFYYYYYFTLSALVEALNMIHSAHLHIATANAGEDAFAALRQLARAVLLWRHSADYC